MTQTTHNSFFKKALSVVLTVVMVFGYVGLLSGVIGRDCFGTAENVCVTLAAELGIADNYTFGVGKV